MSRRASRFAVVVLAMASFVIASRVLGEQYPVGPLSMFSGGLRAASRIVARTEDGRLCELDAFEAYRCEGPIDLRAAAHPDCTNDAEHPEQDRKSEAILRSREGDGEGGRRIVVTRRTFRVDRPSGPVVVRDCALLTCSAKEIAGRCASTR